MWQSNGASPTGHYRQTVEVASAALLRQTLTEALANPWVASYRVQSWREWDASGDPTHCPVGDEIVPAGRGMRECRCGGHAVYHCYRCGWETLCPPAGPECG
jgi:hypothetical protein